MRTKLRLISRVPLLNESFQGCDDGARSTGFHSSRWLVRSSAMRAVQIFRSAASVRRRSWSSGLLGCDAWPISVRASCDDSEPCVGPDYSCHASAWRPCAAML